MLTKIKALFQSEPSLCFLYILFFNAFLLSTIGQIKGLLIPLAVFSGLLIFLSLIYVIWNFGHGLYSEKSQGVFFCFLVALTFNLLWVIIKAPLDIDGLFYHLTIILNALQENQWNADQLLLWHVQSAPKLGVLSSLSLTALFGDYGYRLVHLGHFTSGFIGAYAWVESARVLKLPRKYFFGFLFLFTPLVIKQMGSQYVDLSLYAYWFMALALLLRVVFEENLSRYKSIFIWIGISMCFYMVCSIKLNGAALLFAFLPFLFFIQKKSHTLSLKYFFIPLFGAVISCFQWMYPNYIRFGNPVFPMQLRGLIPGFGVKFVPDENPVYNVMHGFISTLDLNIPFSSFFKWILTFFVFEPVAQYDMVAGAWGFLGLFFLLLVVIKFNKLWKLLKAKQHRVVFFVFILSLLFNPAWTLPRYSFSSGLFLIWFGGILYISKFQHSKIIQFVLSALLLIQLPYVSMDRVFLRGLSFDQRVNLNFSIFIENFKDVIYYGEPQNPERYIHFPYVPLLRKDEPRNVLVGEECVTLSALYYGRHFKNHVRFTPLCCRWPFPCLEIKEKYEEN